jgi:predicted nuclease of predicted toxin-antitoxin system
MGTRFKLDENIPRDAEALLRAAQHDVHSVFDEGADGGPDDRLLDLCRREKRILITLDLDFGDIRLYPPQSHAGVWVLRPPSQSIENMLALLTAALALLDREPAAQRLWIVEQGRVRIRDQ